MHETVELNAGELSLQVPAQRVRHAARDREARRAYRQTRVAADSINEVFMLDIMREKMEHGDSRLR